MSEHLVLWCEAQGCASLFVGPARDFVGRTATLRGWQHATEAEAITAGWLRVKRWEPRTRSNERWYCPSCRADRPRGWAAPLPAEAIPADCPF